MKLTTIDGGWRQRLSPNAKKMAYGNTSINVRNLETGVDIGLGPYDCSGWINDDLVGTTNFYQPEVLNIYNLVTGEVTKHPNMSAANSPIFITMDGANWGCSGGKFFRNEEPIETDYNLSGDLRGQVLDETGKFFSAELINEGYNTAVFDRFGDLQFRVGYKAEFAFVYNDVNSPCIFYTKGDKAIIQYNDEVVEVPCGIAQARGALVRANGVLWAWTLIYKDGLPHAFGRPFDSPKGILLQMPGNFMEARFDELTQDFTIAGYNSQTGQTVAWSEVSIDSERVELGQPPPSNVVHVKYVPGLVIHVD